MTSTTSRTRDDRAGTPPPRRSSGPRQALLVAVVLVVGLGLGLGLARLLSGTDRQAEQPSVQSLDLPSAPSAADAQEEAAPAPPSQDEAIGVEAATSPEAAVEGFLTAEALGDFEASYAFLSEADRTAYPTAAAWVAAHAQFPAISGFEVTDVQDGLVTTNTALRSGVDPVLGLVPARATGTWEVVEEGDGWRVFFGSQQSALAPLYPGDEGVAEVVRTWAAARVECRTEAEVDGTLYGAPALAEQLCDAEGELAFGEPTVLQDGPDTAPLLSAFGPEVFTWARVVELRSPVPMLVVVAPVEDEWQVVAVLPPTAR